MPKSVRQQNYDEAMEIAVLVKISIFFMVDTLHLFGLLIKGVGQEDCESLTFSQR